MLAARPDEEIQNILNANAALLAQQYPSCAPSVLLSLVAETRRQGYALNPGLIVPGIPTKPATHSNRKPATDSDLKPAGVPI